MGVCIPQSVSTRVCGGALGQTCAGVSERMLVCVHVREHRPQAVRECVCKCLGVT